MLRLNKFLSITLSLLLFGCGEPQALKDAASIINPDETDSTLPGTINLGPVVPPIADQTVNEDSSISSIAIHIQDTDSSLTCSANLKAFSGNSLLVKKSKIIVSGTIPNCSLAITPEPNAYGTVDIYLTVEDGTHKVNSKFKLTINPANDAPSINAINPATTGRNQSVTIPFTVVDSDTQIDCASDISITSSNESIVPSSSAVFGGIFPICAVTLTPVTNATGTTIIQVTANDGEFTANQTFNLNVIAVNTPPTVGTIATQNLTEDTPSALIPFTISDTDTLLSCLTSVTVSSSNTDLIDSSSVVFSGSAPACNARITPKENANGTANVTFSVTDGSLATTRTFTANVSSVNDAPTITSIPNKGTPVDIQAMVAFSIEDADHALNCSNSYVSMTTSNPSVFSSSSMVLGGIAPNCLATFTPQPGVEGFTNITLTVSDGSLSSSTTFRLATIGPLAISPKTGTLQNGNQMTFTAEGGSGVGYTFSIVSGGGTIDPVSGLYTATSTGTKVIQVTDSNNNTDTATIVAFDPLEITPANIMVVAENTVQFNVSGGFPPYSYAVTLGNGTINSSGLFTAANIAGNSTITVTDDNGSTVTASVTTVLALTLSPTTLVLPVYSSHTFTAAGGNAPYSFDITSGGGSLNSTTGQLVASSTVGTAVITLTDSGIQSKTANVTYVRPIQISQGLSHTCAVYNNGGIKCWGTGTSGRLGNESTNNLGDAGNEVGGNIPFVNVGTGKVAVQVSAGDSHTCARFNDGSVKCWGDNTFGKLGYGDTTARGSAANQMGDSLPTIDLGKAKLPNGLPLGQQTPALFLMMTLSNAGAEMPTVNLELATLQLFMAMALMKWVTICRL